MFTKSKAEQAAAMLAKVMISLIMIVTWSNFFCKNGLEIKHNLRLFNMITTSVVEQAEAMLVKVTISLNRIVNWSKFSVKMDNDKNKNDSRHHHYIKFFDDFHCK